MTLRSQKECLGLGGEVKVGDVPGKVMDGAFRVARHETHCITIRLTNEHKKLHKTFNWRHRVDGEN